MAFFRPFRALRYARPEGAVRTSLLSPENLAALHAASDGHALLAAPPAGTGERSKFVRYARSAALLAEMRRDGRLVLDDEPGFPRSGEAVLALVRADTDVVVEQVFAPSEIEPRKRLLEATRTFFEPPVGLWEGPLEEREGFVRILSGGEDVVAARELVRRPPAWVPVWLVPREDAAMPTEPIYFCQGDDVR